MNILWPQREEELLITNSSIRPRLIMSCRKATTRPLEMKPWESVQPMTCYCYYCWTVAERQSSRERQRERVAYNFLQQQSCTLFTTVGWLLKRRSALNNDQLREHCRKLFVCGTTAVVYVLLLKRANRCPFVWSHRFLFIRNECGSYCVTSHRLRTSC